MLNWEWAAQFGSFVGGVAAGAGLLGLYFVYRQWRDAHAAEQTANEHRLREEKSRKNDELRMAEAKLVEEISQSINLLLVERSKLWAQALNRFPADIVARSVLAAAAVRTTVSTTDRITTALALAGSKGFGDELLRSIEVSIGVLKTVGKEDMALVKHLQDYDLRFSKLRGEVHTRMAEQVTTDAEHEMLAFHAMDGLIQTSNVFLSLNDTVTDLGAKVEKLRQELDRHRTTTPNIDL